MDLLQRDEFAGLSVASFEDLLQIGSGCCLEAGRLWPLGRQTYSCVCSLSKLLQLLERREMAFAVHNSCG